MSSRRLLTASVLIVAWGLAAGTLARAQDIVPGGWDSEVSVASFRAPGDGLSAMGYGMFGADSWSGWGGTTGMIRAASPSPAPSPGYVANQPQVYNGLLPLGQVIQRSVKKRSRR
jgi:hypothetical protein